jgi:hypothetical protein
MCTAPMRMQQAYLTAQSCDRSALSHPGRLHTIFFLFCICRDLSILITLVCEPSPDPRRTIPTSFVARAGWQVLLRTIVRASQKTTCCLFSVSKSAFCLSALNCFFVIVLSQSDWQSPIRRTGLNLALTCVRPVPKCFLADDDVCSCSPCLQRRNN